MLFPEVYQVVAGEDYTVYAYMNDGSIRLFDAKPLIKIGGIFGQLADKSVFTDKLTVLNNTVSWDFSGCRDGENCIDIDPFEIQSSPIVNDIL